MKNIDNVISQNKSTIKRNLIIKGVVIHVKSIFNGYTTLDKVLGNIVIRKLSETKKKGVKGTGV